MLALVVDGALAALLLAVLGLGLRLQRSLRQLRSRRRRDRAADRCARRGDRTRGQARSTVCGRPPRPRTNGCAGELAGAQRLLDDLQFLTSRGEQLADRLEEQIQQGRPAAPERPRSRRRGAAPAGRAPADRRADLERTLRTLAVTARGPGEPGLGRCRPRALPALVPVALLAPSAAARPAGSA